jgi:peptide/nickel transport system substrate-binding protein
MAAEGESGMCVTGRYLGGISVLAALALLAACGGSPGTAGPAGPGGGAPRRGGNLVFARTADIVSLDPTAIADNESIWATEQIFQTLYTVTPNGKGVQPWLATGYTLSPNRLQWTFHLRPGVRFSNGKPMTAADVAFSINRARHSTQGFGYIDSAIKSVTAPGPSTVVIRTKYPWAPLLADVSLFTNGIMPANFGGKTAAQFFAHPVGTGPFMFSSWAKGQSLKLVRNPYYWQQGKPYLNSVTFTNVPDDNTRALQVEGGQAQIDEFPPLSSIASLAAKPGVVARLFPSTRTDYLLLNEHVRPYQDVHVRRAICYALNRRALVDTVLFGHGSPANSFMPPTLIYYAPGNPGCPYSLTKARQEMAASSVPHGFSTTFLTDSTTEDLEIAQIVQQELKPLGIRVSIQTVNPNQIFTLQGKEEYQMSVDYWTMDIPDPDEICEFFLSPPGGHAESYYTFYNNPQMNRLVAEGARVFSPAQRAKIYAQVQALQISDVPQIPLFYQPFAYAYSSSVHGFFPYPLGNYHLEDVWLSR